MTRQVCSLVRSLLFGLICAAPIPTLTPNLGGFGAHPDHDAHILSTLSAIQILVTQDALDKLDVDRVVKCASFY